MVRFHLLKGMNRILSREGSKVADHMHLVMVVSPVRNIGPERTTADFQTKSPLEATYSRYQLGRHTGILQREAFHLARTDTRLLGGPGDADGVA